ncbi:uncharacterized protein LOC143149709 [Ptiloglossa arizonensis]|uniref:uncharacterized protein LOC143149709 n=1 Tax=Ptiloglossa arizonensis TaxID=3350558 RepID=UPI003FA0A20E
MEKFAKIMEDHIEPCATENNISPAEISKLDDIDLENDDRIKFGCMKACIMKRLGVMDDSNIKPENFQELLEKVFSEPDMVASQAKLANECAEEVKEKTNVCEIAFDFARCSTMKAKNE